MATNYKNTKWCLLLKYFMEVPVGLAQFVKVNTINIYKKEGNYTLIPCDKEIEIQGKKYYGQFNTRSNSTIIITNNIPFTNKLQKF